MSKDVRVSRTQSMHFRKIDTARRLLKDSESGDTMASINVEDYGSHITCVKLTLCNREQLQWQIIAIPKLLPRGDTAATRIAPVSLEPFPTIFRAGHLNRPHPNPRVKSHTEVYLCQKADMNRTAAATSELPLHFY
jgi:hypothetical protein